MVGGGRGIAGFAGLFGFFGCFGFNGGRRRRGRRRRRRRGRGRGRVRRRKHIDTTTTTASTFRPLLQTTSKLASFDNLCGRVKHQINPFGQRGLNVLIRHHLHHFSNFIFIVVAQRFMIVPLLDVSNQVLRIHVFPKDHDHHVAQLPLERTPAPMPPLFHIDVGTC